VVREPAFLKNPYHLFTSYRRRNGKLQKDSAQAISDVLKDSFAGAMPKGVPLVTEGTIGDFQEPAYVDLSNERVRQHLKAMNKVLSSELQGRKIDMGSPSSRINLLKDFEYHFPDEEDLEANDKYNDLRGIWQLLQPSLKYDNISTGGQSVRAAALIVYGFVTHRQKDGKTPVDVLMIGPTTVWQAQAWIGEAQKLYIHAHDSSRYGHPLNEDQFFVFDVSKPRDPLRGTFAPHTPDYSLVETMLGVLSGTSLDEGYDGAYPAVAAACVARKLKGWSEWFKINDHLIDARLVSRLRDQLQYYNLADLRAKTHKEPLDGNHVKNNQEQKRNQEFYYKIGVPLRMICGPDSKLIKPIVRYPSIK
jgi:hypothetical protein